MAQYINKATIVAEINKLKECFVNKRDDFEKGYHSSLNEVSNFINTLEVKEVDLESLREELDKEWNKCEPIDEGMGLEIASIEHEHFDNIAKHFFELGLKAQKGK